MDELVEPFRRMIEDACPPATVRMIEAGGDWRPLWQTIADSGFLDALVPESAGGVGLSLAEVAPLIAVCGEFAVPLPIGETMVARALLANAAIVAPDGPIVLATGAGATPFARVATHVLRGTVAAPQLSAIEELPPLSGGTDLAAVVPGGAAELRGLGALVRSQLIAGAASRVLDISIAYANERAQFGKPIGRQQAVQQQLAVLAEHCVAARIAAAIGARAGLDGASEAAVAKAMASVGATNVTSIAHAVFGAIGISEEHDLQIHTRNLHAWRIADGSESYWTEQLGAAALRSDAAAAGILPFPGRYR